MEEFSANLTKTGKGKTCFYPAVIGGGDVNIPLRYYLAALSYLSDNITAIVRRELWGANRFRGFCDLYLIIHKRMLIDEGTVVCTLGSEPADVRTVTVNGDAHPGEVIGELQKLSLVAGRILDGYKQEHPLGADAQTGVGDLRYRSQLPFQTLPVVDVRIILPVYVKADEAGVLFRFLLQRVGSKTPLTVAHGNCRLSAERMVLSSVARIRVISSR